MILVVDDNPVQALTRKAILAGAGLDAQTVYSAEAAFDALDHDDSRAISLVITDHIMPGESGSHFVRRLWERRPGLHVMVLSGLAEAEDDYAGLDITFRAKPIRPYDLVELARQLSADKPISPEGPISEDLVTDEDPAAEKTSITDENPTLPGLKLAFEFD